MEQKFLMYLIYITIVDIRARASESNDKLTFNQCDLIHNIPLMLAAEPDGKKAYDYFMEKIEINSLDNWLNMRKEEFYSHFPEYANNGQR